MFFGTFCRYKYLTPATASQLLNGPHSSVSMTLKDRKKNKICMWQKSKLQSLFDLIQFCFPASLEVNEAWLDNPSPFCTEKQRSSGGIPNRNGEKYNHNECLCTILHSKEKAKRPHKVFSSESHLSQKLSPRFAFNKRM